MTDDELYKHAKSRLFVIIQENKLPAMAEWDYIKFNKFRNALREAHGALIHGSKQRIIDAYNVLSTFYTG